MQKNQTLKWVINRSKGQLGKMIALVLCNAFFAVLTVAFAFAVKTVIDGAVNKNTNTIIFGSVFIGAIVVLQFVFRIIINGLLEHIKARLEMAYKSYMFAEIFKKKYSQITAYHSGELINRLTSDVRIISEAVAELLPSVVGSATRLICAVVALCVIDWIFAIAFVVAGVLVFAVMGLLRSKLKFFHKKTQETDGKTRSYMQESIENLLVVKASGANGNVLSQADALQEENFKIKMKRRNYSVLGHSAYNFIFSAGYVFALILGGLRIYNGVLGYGDLSAILQLVNSVQVPFASLSNVVPRYFAMIASAERLMEIEALPSDSENVCDNPAKLYADTKAICIENLNFAYDNDAIFKNASLRIEKGQSIALVGRSGSGKSTLLKILMGIYDAQGEIYVDCGNKKIPVGEYTRPLFSYVPQGNMLFSGTLKDNLTFMNANASDQQIEKALEVACATEFVGQLENGLATVIGEGGAGLSEGQIQRLAIARAVLSQAPVMLLDEATSALDRPTEHAVVENLLTLQDKTVIMISHRKEADSLCKRTVVLSNKTLSDKK